MSRRTFRYHPDYAPEGRIFDLDEVSDELLQEQGWTDHPWKAGFNPWGEQNDPEMQRVRNGVQNGDIKPVDDDAPILPNENENQKSAELEHAHRMLRQQREENEALKLEMQRMREKELDHESDAAKIMAKTAGQAADQAVRNRQAAEKAEAERKAAEEAAAKEAELQKDPPPVFNPTQQPEDPGDQNNPDAGQDNNPDGGSTEL